MVAINFEGFAVNLVSTLAKKPFCFFSISIWILLDDTYAISMPEKKADSNNDETIMMMAKVIYCFGSLLLNFLLKRFLKKNIKTPNPANPKEI